jgi:Cu(I)/Ag(I) efflux system membrane fusion protein
MDANYRKDKPGKSPMGMDLVPVYDDAIQGEYKGADEGAGTIRISSAVENNLGVRTSVARLDFLNNEINTVGYVTYDEDTLVHIHPRVEGWIEKLHVTTVGNTVKKGDPLYEIYSPELVNAQEELLLALDRKNKRLIRAAQDRLTALQLPEYAISRLKKSKKVQQRITFYAPQNGVIGMLKIREGFFVKPGSTLMSIADLSNVWVEGEVFEQQAGLVKRGANVSMVLDYLPGRTWQGKVDYIYPALNTKTRTVKIRLRFKNDEGYFKPNMFAKLTIHSSGNEQALLIPKEALIRTGSQNRVVLALGEGSFKSIAVTVGRFDNESVEIIEGLAVGEKVVSSAQFLLDSESSKSSDFKRMNNTYDGMQGSMDASMNARAESVNVEDMDEHVSSATVTGTVNSLMPEHGMINISRAAIPKWNREAATIDFITDGQVSLSGITPKMEVTFTFEIRAGNFVIVKLEKHQATDVLGSSDSSSANNSSH